LEGVDREGVEEFVGYYEGGFVFAYLCLVETSKMKKRNLPDGTKCIFSVQMIGIFAYLLVL
jgi:hypothetical protein